MPESSYNSKRVAKNTLILYIRMFFIMLVSLYTSRVILQVLGIEDYGVYNVVGGVVSMFSIISSSISTAIGRFITIALGEKNIEKLKIVFSTSIIIQFTLAIIIGILIEIIGVWYLYNKMNIPPGRTDAAFWVLQCSIVTFGLGLISVPYDAEIVAHERMDVYAYFSILDAAMALLIVYLLRIIPFDKLIIYAILCTCASLIMRIIYGIFCKRAFEECRFQLVFNKKLLKELGSFTGWHLLGETTWILNNQGVNLVVNSFFGVTLNAARAVAGQVNNAVGKFSGNFMTALNPQITKTYAEGDLESMHSLIFRGAKFSYILMFFLALPILLETPTLLDLWLDKVPDYAVSFTRLTIISSLIVVLGNTLVKAQLATGNIKRYQIVISLCGFWVFPLTWLAYRLGASPEWSYYIYISVYFLMLFVRVYLVKDLIQMQWQDFFRNVFMRVAIVTVVSSAIPVALHCMQEESIWRLVTVSLVSILSIALTSYYLGIDNNERTALTDSARKAIGRLTGKKIKVS